MIVSVDAAKQRSFVYSPRPTSLQRSDWHVSLLEPLGIPILRPRPPVGLQAAQYHREAVLADFDIRGIERDEL